jgi:hypothetical protein
MYLKKIDYFLKGMSIRVGVFFLFCPFNVPFPNTTSIFFTISNTSFSVYYFGARCQNAFSSYDTYVFLTKTIGVACTLIFWMMKGTLMQFHLCTVCTNTVALYNPSTRSDPTNKFFEVMKK